MGSLSALAAQIKVSATPPALVPLLLIVPAIYCTVVNETYETPVSIGSPYLIMVASLSVEVGATISMLRCIGGQRHSCLSMASTPQCPLVSAYKVPPLPPEYPCVSATLLTSARCTLFPFSSRSHHRHSTPCSKCQLSLVPSFSYSTPIICPSRPIYQLPEWI